MGRVLPNLPAPCFPGSPGASASPPRPAPVPAGAALAWPGAGPQAGCCMGAGLCTRLRVSGSSVHSLKEQKNLNSFFAIMFGLSNSAISRLAQTWEVSAICRGRPGPSHLGPESGPCPFWGSFLGMELQPQSSDSPACLSFTEAAPQSPEALLGPREAAGECWAPVPPSRDPDSWLPCSLFASPCLLLGPLVYPGSGPGSLWPVSLGCWLRNRCLA